MPMMLEHAFYCKVTKSMATTKTSPSTPEQRVHLSGTKVRDLNPHFSQITLRGNFGDEKLMFSRIAILAMQLRINNFS